MKSAPGIHLNLKFTQVGMYRHDIARRIPDHVRGVSTYRTSDQFLVKEPVARGVIIFVVGDVHRYVDTKAGSLSSSRDLEVDHSDLARSRSKF